MKQQLFHVHCKHGLCWVALALTNKPYQQADGSKTIQTEETLATLRVNFKSLSQDTEIKHSEVYRALDGARMEHRHIPNEGKLQRRPVWVNLQFTVKVIDSRQDKSSPLAPV